MKRLFRTTPVLMLILIMMAATISVSAYDYNYKISLSAGNGSFGGSAIETGDAGYITVTNNSNTFDLCGQSYTISQMPDGKAPDESIYFVRGVKLAGEDNGVNNGTIFAAGTIDPKGETAAKYKEKDLQFVVAYGLRSSMVQYTISYVGTDGATLHPTETFYGIPGDVLILSAKYADGYQPRGITGQAIISADESENDFTFIYDPVDANGRVITVIDNVPGGANGAGGAGAGGAGAGAGAGDGAGANIGDGATPLAEGPADTVNLNDNNTPLVDEADNVDENATPLANVPMPIKVAAGVAVIALLAAIALIISKRRKLEEEE